MERISTKFAKFIVSTFAVALAGWGSAHAQDYGGGYLEGGDSAGPAPEAGTESAPAGEMPNGQVGLDVTLFSGSQGLGFGAEVSQFLLVPRVWGWYAITPEVAASLDWGFPFVSVSPEMGDSESGFHAGNPFLAGWYVLPLDDMHGRVGAGVAPPLASVPDDPTDATTAALAYDGALLANGLMNPWLWAPETLSFAIPGRLEKRIGGNILVGGDLAFAVLIPTGDREGDTDVFMQSAGEFGYAAGPGTFGARLQGGWIVTADGDNFQLSVEPFARFDFGRAFAQARFTLNLDEPGGFAFDDGRYWGLHVGGGVNL